MAAQGPGVDVLKHGQFLHKPEVLPEGSDLPSLGWSTTVQVVPLPENAALIGQEASVAESDQAGFACPAPPQQNGGLPQPDREVEGLEPTGQSSPAELQYRHQRTLPS